MSSIWNRFVDEGTEIAPVDRTVESHVFRWIKAGVAALGLETPGRSVSASKAYKRKTDDWKGLATVLKSLVKAHEGIRRMLLMEWLSRLTYLLSPAVSGVSLEVSKTFAKGLWDDKMLEGQKDAATGHHREIISFVVTKKRKSLADHLTVAVQEYAKELFNKELELGLDGDNNDAAKT